MMIPQREETGIYEDHPGLNPTYERDLGEDFEQICSELSCLFYLSPDRDLPPSWPIRDFTLFILRDVDITYPCLSGRCVQQPPGMWNRFPLLENGARLS